MSDPWPSKIVDGVEYRLIGGEWRPDPKATAEPQHVCDNCGARIVGGVWSCGCREAHRVLELSIIVIGIGGIVALTAIATALLIRGVQ